ncbi:unnamed protein product [Rhodiola kirilowii]
MVIWRRDLCTEMIRPENERVWENQSHDPFTKKLSTFIPSFSLVTSSPQKQPKITQTAPRISMRTAAKQAYVCRDCGYIYNDKTPFDKLPDKYFCPCNVLLRLKFVVCGAPKRRFKPYTPPVDKNANSTDIRKARKAELKRDEAVGKGLPIAIGVGVAVLAGLYFYLNNSI